MIVRTTVGRRVAATLAAVALAGLTACGSSGTSAKKNTHTGGASPTTSSGGTQAAAGGSSQAAAGGGGFVTVVGKPCTLFTTTDLNTALAESFPDGKSDPSSPLVNCKWATQDLAAGSVDASITKSAETDLSNEFSIDPKHYVKTATKLGDDSAWYSSPVDDVKTDISLIVIKSGYKVQINFYHIKTQPIPTTQAKILPLLAPKFVVG